MSRNSIIPILAVASITLFSAMTAIAETVEPLPYGNFNSWTSRLIKESAVIGGKQKTLYAVGPEKTVEGNKAYHAPGVPWATSNVYAKMSGVTKGSNRILATAWDVVQQKFRAEILIGGIDRHGILSELTAMISTQLGIDIRALNIAADKEVFECRLGVMVDDTGAVDSLCAKVKKIKGVKSAVRVS